MFFWRARSLIFSKCTFTLQASTRSHRVPIQWKCTLCTRTSAGDLAVLGAMIVEGQKNLPLEKNLDKFSSRKKQACFTKRGKNRRYGSDAETCNALSLLRVFDHSSMF